MALIKLHQFNLRSRKVFAKLVELSYIVEIRVFTLSWRPGRSQELRVVHGCIAHW
jgi:hypothetical protein